MQPPISCTFTLFADYHQFYLQDEHAETGTPDDWGEQLATHMIAVNPGIVGIGTARAMSVPVRVDLLATRPDADFSAWDQVAEASLEVSSDQIVIAGCSDYFPAAQRLPVSPGSYRVRVYYGGLHTLSADGLDGDDHYHLVLWPENYRPAEVLKKRSSW